MWPSPTSMFPRKASVWRIRTKKQIGLYAPPPLVHNSFSLVVSFYLPTVLKLTSAAAHLFRTLPMDDSANTEELKPADDTSTKVLRPTAQGANPKEPMLTNSAH